MKIPETMTVGAERGRSCLSVFSGFIARDGTGAHSPLLDLRDGTMPHAKWRERCSSAIIDVCG